MNKSEQNINVTFINDVEEADVWILPQTESNLKTSLWGTPDFSKLKAGEKATCESIEAAEKYIVRIIDTDQALYTAKDIALDDGCAIYFHTDDTKYDSKITVLDKTGKTIETKENIFEGVLG